MEWIEAMNKSLEYMENNLLNNISVEDVAKQVYMSSFHFQRGFHILTGYTVGEYLRNRRLTLAAYDILKNEEKLIDIAYKYGYETPESFSKAFRRFHRISPSQVKAESYKLQSFQRLIVKIKVEGGNTMDVRIEKKEGFKVFGIKKSFKSDTAFTEIPKFWNEFSSKYCNGGVQKLYGMFGVCIDEGQSSEFSYVIGDIYDGDKISEEFEIVEIPRLEWAVFRCVGPMPTALQSVNTRIWKEWLPTNGVYEIAAGYNVEMYTKGDISSPDYLSEIWIPVKRKDRL